jgi:putative membrane protein
LIFRERFVPDGIKQASLKTEPWPAPRKEKTMAIRMTAVLAASCLLLAGLPAQSAEKLTDPQIAHIAYTAGVIDIDAAKQALKKAHDKDVKAFAKDMLRDHKAVNDQALALVKKLKVTPQDNATSKALTKAAKAEHAKLAKLHGAAFDKAYIANEVAFHKQVDGALKTLLIPSAHNPQLKDLLQTGLKIFEGHEEHAEHVQSELK